MKKFFIFIIVGMVGFFTGNAVFTFDTSRYQPFLKGFFHVENNIHSDQTQTPATAAVTPKSIVEPEVVIEKRELFSLSPDGFYLAYFKEGKIFIKNKKNNEERLILKTRLNIADISWPKSDFIVIKTISLDGSITHYKKYKLNLEGNLKEI